MSDYCVARVLTQLQHAEGELADLENIVRAQMSAPEVQPALASELQWHDQRMREQFLLGQIEALTRAQIALANRRAAYSQSHMSRRLRPGVEPTSQS